VDSSRPLPATGLTDEFMIEGRLMEAEAEQELVEDAKARKEHHAARLRFAALVLVVICLGVLTYIGLTWSR
jgi:hypothetical protein